MYIGHWSAIRVNQTDDDTNWLLQIAVLWQYKQTKLTDLSLIKQY